MDLLREKRPAVVFTSDDAVGCVNDSLFYIYKPKDNQEWLLAHKQEIRKFTRKVNERGLTIVPLEIYLKGNLIKMKIALARGKNVRDKKEAIKERDLNRDTRRQLRELNSY